MRRQGAKNRHSNARTLTETRTRELSGQKSAQKRPIWRRIGNVWFARTEWWSHQGSNLGPNDYSLALTVLFQLLSCKLGRLVWPADLVQMNGLGSALWFSRYSMMALLSSATLLKAPRRIRFRVISAKNRSTMLRQEAVVIAGYMGEDDAFEDALASFAMVYAARTQEDFDWMVKAAARGTPKPAKRR